MNLFVSDRLFLRTHFTDLMIGSIQFLFRIVKFFGECLFVKDVKVGRFEGAFPCGALSPYITFALVSSACKADISLSLSLTILSRLEMALVLSSIIKDNWKQRVEWGSRIYARQSCQRKMNLFVSDRLFLRTHFTDLMTGSIQFLFRIVKFFDECLVVKDVKVGRFEGAFPCGG
jgi:hypothetical protein